MMNSLYYHNNFFVCPTSSSDIHIIRRLPLFFTDLRYEESELGFYGILYRRDLDHRDCMNSFLEDKIRQIEMEFGKYEKYRKDVSKKISDSIESIFCDIFDEQRANLTDNLLIMRRSMYEE